LLAHRWAWLAVGAVLGGLAAYLVANKLVHSKFTASAQLLRYQTPGASDFLKSDTPMTPETFAGLLRAPDLFRRVGEAAVPPISPDDMAKQIKVDPDDESDLVNVILAARDPHQAVDLLNIYLTNSVDYLRDLQARDIRIAADTYLGEQVRKMDEDIAELDKEFRLLAMPWEVTNKTAQVGAQLNELGRTLAGAAHSSPALAVETERLNQALGELSGLLSIYTELHPKVQQKQAEVKALRAQISAESTNLAAAAPTPGVVAAPSPQGSSPTQPFNPEVDIIRARLLSLEQGRVQLLTRQREAEMYAKSPPGVARVFAPATLTTVKSSHRRVKIAIGTVIGAIMGAAGSLLLVLLVEFADGRLRTVDDVRRVTRLPVLTTLGDTAQMNAEAQAQWAFRTWTLLQGRLSPKPHHGLVCGFTSSSQGEGRSTWIRLLAEAASLTGFKVLTVATRPPNGEKKPGVNHVSDLLAEALQASDPGEGMIPTTNDALSSPAQISERLTGPNSQPVVHIPLPGWAWNRERRQQWSEALDHWRKIENIVILVELPPADVPETVLLGSNLPNLIWLADSGTAEATSTRDQLETLRHAHCNIVGAVLNRETAPTLKKKFPRWITSLAFLAWLGLTANAQPASPSPAPAPQTNLSFSIVHPSQRAAWQEHLTLGPGDVLNFGLFGQPEVAALEVPVGPDGRVSYLEAEDVMAAGLTIDELRARLDQELGKYRRAPHTMITPVAFRSKKYFVMGTVMAKGAYVLDRPITIVEAIARAKGFESGLVDRSVVDLADFSRSFIARGGKRMPFDLQKLFQSGDLSQNIAIEPGDYIYISAENIKEVYIVGEVRLPGPLTYSPSATVISAITARGGFTDRAYRSRVLVVRGPLEQPITMAVDTAAIVNGKTTDFKLQPKDIVFVSPRPFIRVEELADLATTAFIQGLITAWVDVKVVNPYPQ
jgi:protein involved in polysaccharide export with SLBB domain/capsular polysaccharide biosynthesis protein